MAAALRTLRAFLHPPVPACRCSYAGSPSNNRWLDRQSRDPYTKAAKVMELKSRAAFKLLEINEKYSIFKRGQTVVDLGYAPGSWSQVAIDRVSPGGRVVGLDIIPVLPPKGVSTFQGNFLDPAIQKLLRDFLSDPDRGRLRAPIIDQAYIDIERIETEGAHPHTTKCVDVVLSDMSEPWPLVMGSYYQQSLTRPYNRLMNTSGISFRDHAGSMDLCNAALGFCLDVLKPGGHFVCKFYAGSEDKMLEGKLRKVFKAVWRDKPDSSRKESKENFFVAKDLKRDAVREMVEEEPVEEFYDPLKDEEFDEPQDEFRVPEGDPTSKEEKKP